MRLQNALLAMFLLCTIHVDASIGRNEAARRATELSQANGHVYRLIGSCTTQVCAAEIDRALTKLETNSLSAPSAAKYRQARVKIEEGYRYYQEAKAAAGREQSRLVQLGNTAMQIAKTLIRAAMEYFQSVIQQIMAGQGWGGAPENEDDEEREKRCTAERQARRDRCDEEYEEEMKEINKRWQKRQSDCSKIIRRLEREQTKEGQFNLRKEYHECMENARNAKDREEQAAKAEKQRCYQHAQEQFEKCMRGEKPW